MVRHEDELFVFFNAAAALPAYLPEGRWTRILDTTDPDVPATPCADREVLIAAQSVTVFAHLKLVPATGKPQGGSGE